MLYEVITEKQVEGRRGGAVAAAECGLIGADAESVVEGVDFFVSREDDFHFHDCDYPFLNDEFSINMHGMFEGEKRIPRPSDTARSQPFRNPRRTPGSRRWILRAGGRMFASTPQPAITLSLLRSEIPRDQTQDQTPALLRFDRVHFHRNNFV